MEKITGLESTDLGAAYPCCGGRARFSIFDDAGRQRFDRTCGRCGRKYVVDVVLIRRSAGLKMHSVEWDWTGYHDERIRRDYRLYGGERVK